MEFKPDYRIYLADPLGFSDNPFIVTTVYTNAGGYPKGEYFLVVPEGNGKIFTQEVCLKLQVFPEGQVKFDEVFLLNDMLEQAKRKLRTYILQTQGDQALDLLSKRLDVMETSKNQFVNFWLHGSYHGCLREIRWGTQCGPLGEFLQWVFDLPTFDVRDFY